MRPGRLRLHVLLLHAGYHPWGLWRSLTNHPGKWGIGWNTHSTPKKEKNLQSQHTHTATLHQQKCQALVFVFAFVIKAVLSSEDKRRAATEEDCISASRNPGISTYLSFLVFYFSLSLKCPNSTEKGVASVSLTFPLQLLLGNPWLFSFTAGCGRNTSTGSGTKPWSDATSTSISATGGQRIQKMRTCDASSPKKITLMSCWDSCPPQRERNQNGSHCNQICITVLITGKTLGRMDARACRWFITILDQQKYRQMENISYKKSSKHFNYHWLFQPHLNQC